MLGLKARPGKVRELRGIVLVRLEGSNGMGVNNSMIITDGIHLTSTENEEELHAFAGKMGLKREWFQCHSDHPERRRPHYDLTTRSAVNRALIAGAKRVTGSYLLRNSWWAEK